jgi:hypothetical protein
LTRNFDEPPSSFAFKLNLRRYNVKGSNTGGGGGGGGGFTFGFRRPEKAAAADSAEANDGGDYQGDYLGEDLGMARGGPAFTLGARLRHGGAAVADADDLPGKAVQVDPINSTLQAPGSKRSKLEHETLLSNVAFNFNLRRFTQGRASTTYTWGGAMARRLPSRVVAAARRARRQQR